MTKKKRDFERTRGHILKTAFWEVYTRGFQGVSIDEIVKKTGMTKGAFYHHFPTKLDLGYALVDDVLKPMILERWITPLENFKNPLDGILKQLKKNIGECEDLTYGCPLNNLVQEMAPVDAGFRKRLQGALTLWIEETDRHLVRAKREGYLKKDVNTRELAEFIVMAHEGFYGIIKGTGEPKMFGALFGSLKKYFAAISAPVNYS